MSDNLLRDISPADTQGMKLAILQRWIKQACLNAGLTGDSSDPLLRDISVGGDSEGVKFAILQRWTAYLANNIGSGSIPTITCTPVVITSDGNWAKPANLAFVRIEAYGGGSGGGSGRRGAASSTRSGGGGGGPGAKVIVTLSEDQIADGGLDIEIGLGGDGGAAQTVDSQNGNAGSIGGKTIVTSGGNTIAVANGGQPSSGGGTNVQSNAGAHGVGSVPGINGYFGFASTLPFTYPNTSETAGGGGGGGGISTANALTNGTDGLSRGTLWGDTTVFGGAGAGLAGSPDGTNGTEDAPGRPGGGGGGGSPQAADRGGNGGNGGRSAGGGGGAGSLNGYNSGAGGRGGDGFVVIYPYIFS